MLLGGGRGKGYFPRPSSHFDRVLAPRRGARVVDRDGLENRCARKGTVGSNPTLSANHLFLLVSARLTLRQRPCSIDSCASDSARRPDCQYPLRMKSQMIEALSLPRDLNEMSIAGPSSSGWCPVLCPYKRIWGNRL